MLNFHGGKRKMDTFTTQVHVELRTLALIHKLMLFLVSGVAVVDCQTLYCLFVVSVIFHSVQPCSCHVLNNKLFICSSSGESNIILPMVEKRGGCCAVISHIPDNSGGCSSSMSTERLVALGSLRNLSTVEMFKLDRYAWQDMPPMRETRELCTAVVSPLQFEF